MGSGSQHFQRYALNLGRIHLAELLDNLQQSTRVQPTGTHASRGLDRVRQSTSRDASSVRD
jgi:hypothetical protein